MEFRPSRQTRDGFLFKINLVYIINYFMFVFQNANGYEKFDKGVDDFHYGAAVTKPVRTGYS
jgi:hypothetical protein